MSLTRINRFTLLVLVLSLSGCAGSQAWEQMFAPDPNAQTENGTQPTPTETKFPPELQFPQATLEQTTPLPNGLETRWRTSQPPQAIQGFFQQRLPQLGWQLQPPQTQDGTQPLILAQKAEQQFSLTLGPSAVGGTEFSLKLIVPNASPSPTNSPSPTPLATPNTLPPQTFTDLNQAPATLQPALQDLAELGVLTSSKPQANQFNPNQVVTRGIYARWLLTAHNRFYDGRPARQIRLATPNDQPLFKDVPTSHPDFAYIQGLAAAGFLPSSLTGDANPNFRPNAPLLRENLLQWKVPLDVQKTLTAASIDRVEQTWGFKDSNRITPESLSAVAADYQNGDLSNIRRIFGSTLLLQPKKPVTRAEAAASLWYLGNQAGDGLSAQDVLTNGNPTPTNS